MELSQALENIKQSGAKFKKEEILCIRENKEVAIPALLDIVRNVADNFDEIPERTEDVPNLAYAMFLLAEFKVHEALDPIVRILELDEEKCEWLLCDMITEDMDSIIASIATTDDIERIQAVVEDSMLGEYQRCAALNALTIMYSQGIYPRAELVDYLGELLETCDDHAGFISWVACACEEIAATEHYERIRNLFEEGRVEEIVIGVGYFPEDAPLATEEVVLKRIKENWHRQIITDTVDSMHWWACFEENQTLDTPIPSVTEKTAKPSVFDNPKFEPPAIAKKKVGRNEPCPCGSGKKYKKCCLIL